MAGKSSEFGIFGITLSQNPLRNCYEILHGKQTLSLLLYAKFHHYRYTTPKIVKILGFLK